MANISSVPAEDELLEEIDLRQCLNVLHKWRFLIIGLTILAMLVSGILSFYVLDPVYETKAIVMVNQQKDSSAEVQQELQEIINKVSRLPSLSINTYVSQMTTPALLKQVIDKLGLDKEFYTPSNLAKIIEVKAIKDTNLIEISVQNTDPVLAANIANTLTEEFLKFINENNQKQMVKSVSFLEQQKEKVDADLAEANKALIEFNARPNSVDLLDAQKDKMIQDLALYESELQRANVEIKQLTAAKARLEDLLANTEPKITLKQPLLTIGGEQELAAGPIGQVETVNPVYTQIQEQIVEKETAIADKEAQIQGLQKAISELNVGLKELQADLTAKRAQQKLLERRVNELDEASSILSQKITETGITKSINLGDTTVVPVSSAMVPTKPIKPNKKLNIAIAAVLGLMVSVFLAFFLEYLKNSDKDAATCHIAGNN